MIDTRRNFGLVLNEIGLDIHEDIGNNGLGDDVEEGGARIRVAWVIILVDVLWDVGYGIQWQEFEESKFVLIYVL